MGEIPQVTRALHKQRLALGLTRAEAAARFHAPMSRVRSWELGLRGMSLVQAYEYGAVLGVRPVLVAGERVPVPVEACPDAAGVPPVLVQLRATRRARELSRPEVAALLGAGATTLPYWEMGHRAIPLARTHDYADVLGLVLTVEEISPSVTALVEAGARPNIRGGP